MGIRLFLIDSVAPFCITCNDNEEINWSKVPFTLLERNNTLDPATCAAVEKAFNQYCNTVSSLGYNALSIDDVAHLVNQRFYSLSLNNKINSYKEFYARLFAIAQKYALKIFITTDVMFYNDYIRKYTARGKSAVVRVLATSIRQVFKEFPFVSGIIFRIGECDGVDVEGDFVSRLVIKTPRQLRGLIKSLLPLFEKYEKLLIMRTWTLGAFKIGDLLWNKETFERVFNTLVSDNLVLSLKFGETDFFRYLNFNPLFFQSHHRKIIELQTRREYEGFGEFPSFVGNDYEKYSRYINLSENVIGISVWCQTGGWSHFTRLTFLKNSSLWNEINTFVTIRIFRDGVTAEEAVAEFCRQRFPEINHEKLTALLKLSDRLIKEVWYIPEFSSKRIYFRRTRVPPLLWIFWDNILINHSLRKVIRRFVHERREAVHEGYRLLHKIHTIKKYAREIGLDTEVFDYQYDTFSIVAAAREYYLGKWDPSIPKRIVKLVREYNTKYPHGFHILYDFSPVHFKKWLIKTIFKISLRQHPHYRLLDKLFLNRFASLVYPIFNYWQKRRLDDFYREQAMGIQVLFK